MHEEATKDWILPDGWRKELSALIQHFSKLESKNDFYNLKLERFLVVSEKNVLDKVDRKRRVFLYSGFYSKNAEDIVEEALNYLDRTLVEGYCDVIYPNWGDTSMDLLQMIAGMGNNNGDLLLKQPRHNDWPLRGGFSQKIKEQCFALGKLDCNVMITAPSGCGKEAIARLIHRASGCDGQFVSVSIPSIPPNLFYSVLFGYEKGAYTGAENKQLGAFERAAGGTLFLDEIADINKEQQAALLRALSERKGSSIDGTREYEISCRIVSSTNRFDILRNSFRSDLRIRLAEQEVLHATKPNDWQPIRPLTTVRDQIPLLLAMQFVRCFREQLGYEIRVPSYRLTLLEQPDLDAKSVLKRMSQIDWTMNFRQLQQVCLSAILRHLTNLDCMKGILHNPDMINKALRENEFHIILKLYSKRDQNASPLLDVNDVMLNMLSYGDVLGEGKRWENIATWIRKKVVQYLIDNGITTHADIARVLEVNRSCISRFRNKFMKHGKEE